MGRKGKRHKANRAERRKGTCVYCGITGQVEDEDVLPRCLYPRNPSKRVLVPSCRPCNVEKSKDDDFLRDMLVSDADSYGNPIAWEILRTKVASSYRRNSSILWRSADSDGSYGPRYSRGGVFLGDFFLVPVEGSRVIRAYSTMTRGLHFYVHGQRFPDNYECKVGRVDKFRVAELWSNLSSPKFNINGPFRIDGVFGCAFTFSQDDRSLGLWLLWFYESIYITVQTGPKGYFHQFVRTTLEPKAIGLW